MSTIGTHFVHRSAQLGTLANESVTDSKFCFW